jgi:hypothetical protein
MNNLIKIRNMSSKYDISVRTLRYYEDMGMIESTRNDDYAYRLYDAASLAIFQSSPWTVKRSKNGYIILFVVSTI